MSTYLLQAEATATSNVSSLEITNLDSNVSAFVARVAGTFHTAGDLSFAMNNYTSQIYTAANRIVSGSRGGEAEFGIRLNFSNKDVYDVFYAEMTMLQPGNTGMKNVASYIFGSGDQWDDPYPFGAVGGRFDNNSTPITSLKVYGNFAAGTSFKVWSME